MVGPDTLARMKSARLRAERHRLGDGQFGTMTRRRSIEFLQRVLALVGIVLVLLSSGVARQWMVESAATICVVGGFVAAPILTLTAWVGMMTPNLLLLHRVSTLLFLVAIIWLALAFIGAHLHHSQEQTRNNTLR